MKIILSAIAGNEEAVIERFVRSFAPAVDEFVFVRAIGIQEPDETVEIIRRTCSELGKVADFLTYENKTEFCHVDNFGTARQLSLTAAADGAEEGDYIIWADADDVLIDGGAEEIRAAAESGSHEVFLMPYHVRGDKQVVWRERMVKADLGAQWEHAIHEQMIFPREVSYRMIRGAVIEHSPLDAKAGGHERNLAILQSELRDTPRNMFYLAQELFQNGKLREFRPIAEAALVIPSMDTLERYEILMQLAQTPGTKSKDLAASAFALMPDRREALALLTNYAIIDGDHAKALSLADVMMSIPKPRKTYWSLNNEWYGWKGDELFRQCLRLNGREDAADDHWQESNHPDHPTFSIIHATLDRPDQALAVREMWLSRASRPENVDYVFGIHNHDKRSLNVLSGIKHTETELLGSSPNWDVAAGAAVGGIIVQASDDGWPPQGWDDSILSLIPDVTRPVFLAGDGHERTELPNHAIMTRAYMEINAAVTLRNSTHPVVKSA